MYLKTMLGKFYLLVWVSTGSQLMKSWVPFRPFKCDPPPLASRTNNTLHCRLQIWILKPVQWQRSGEDFGVTPCVTRPQSRLLSWNLLALLHINISFYHIGNASNPIYCPCNKVLSIIVSMTTYINRGTPTATWKVLYTLHWIQSGMESKKYLI